jgi:hypothetical protein
MFAHRSGPKNIHALLKALDKEGIQSLRDTPAIRELITFLRQAVTPELKQKIG